MFYISRGMKGEVYLKVVIIGGVAGGASAAGADTDPNVVDADYTEVKK